MKITLIQILKNNVNNDKGITFINEKKQEEYLSYVQLYEKAKRYLGGLQRFGLIKGDKVIFQISNNKDYIVLFWACILGGFIVVPVTKALTSEEENKLFKINKILKNAWVIQSKKEKNNHSNNNEEYNIIDIESLRIDEYGKIANVKQQDTAFIQFSSGSTGEPKGVILSHSNLVHNTEAIVSEAQIQEDDKTLSWMPLTHDMGMIGFHLAPLVAGIHQCIMSTSLFIKQPILWMDKVVEHSATILSSPNFGFKIFLNALKNEKEKNWNLSKVKRIFNGAEPISIDICKDFVEKLKQYNLKENTIYTVYGLAEATLGVTFSNANKPIRWIEIERNQVIIGNAIKPKTNVNTGVGKFVSFVNLGSPIKYTKIRVTDDNNTILQNNYVGNLEVYGESITEGYINNKKANKELFTEDGWLKTGDIGFLYKNELYITGRKKDIIFIHGQNYYSSDIENYIEKKQIVKSGSCVACGIPDDKMNDELIVFVQYRGKIDSFCKVANQIKNEIAKELRVPIKYVLPCNIIHKTTSGKVRRHKFIEEYLNGEYQQIIKQIETINEYRINDVHNMNEIENDILKLFKDILNLADLSRDDHFISLGGDSIKAQVLLDKVNSMYHINLDLREVYNDFTVEGITNKISNANKTTNLLIPKCDIRQEYPVLPSQEQLYILNEISNTDKLFNLIMLYDIKGKIDKSKLEKSINVLIEKYEILRTTFDYVNNNIVHKVHNSFKFRIQECELKEENLYEVIEQLNSKFDLKELPLLKIVILKLENRKEKLLIQAHHIIADGTSFGIFLRELQEIYNDTYVEKSFLQFKDYAAWRKEQFNLGMFENKKSYWLNQYAKSIPRLDLSIASGSIIDKDYIGHDMVYQLSLSTVTKVRKLSKEIAFSNFTILFAAYAILLNKYNKSEDVIIGVPYANRKYLQLANSIGMFINTLPFRVHVDVTKNVKEFLNEINCLILEGFENGEYYCEELLRDLQQENNITTIYNTVFTFQNMDVPNVILGEAALVEEKIPVVYSKTDITFEVYPKEDQIVINIEYLKNNYKKEDIYKLIKDYENILERISMNYNATILDTIAIDTEETYKLLKMSTYQEIDKKFSSFPDRFQLCTLKYPNHIALKFQGKEITYAGLQEKVEKLAHFISKNLPNNKIVGIWMDNSIEQIIAMLSILRAGGAYLPIDKIHPVERMKYILTNSECKLLIIDEELKEELSYQEKNISFQDFDFDQYQGKILKNKIHKNDLAYIIYTSGSTGNPKGVMVEHRNLVAYIEAFLNEFDVTSNDVMLHQASIGFDASVEEVFPILTRGGSLAIIEKSHMMDAKYLIDFLKENKVSILSVSPHLINEINKFWKGNQIHTFISGGDVLRNEYITNLYSAGNIYNTYGPTETTVCATYHKVTKEDEGNIPIGRPIKNYEVYILDRNLQLCPVGVEGEICISGSGVTRGYLNNEELTKIKFIKNPYNPNYKLYHTGDMGYWLDEGEIRYTGRCDNQLNIRGYRIELGEIENKLLMHEEIEEVVVIGKDYNNELYLCGYIRGTREFTVEELNFYLRKSLPNYMIPSYFVNMKSMPMNTSGKIDKSMLPEPFEHIVVETEYIEPCTKLEKSIAKLWTEILGIKKIGRFDRFFDIGGQSLKAIMLVGKLQEEFNVNVSINFIFQYTTIQEQADNLYEINEKEQLQIKRVEKKDLYETSFMQKNMFSIQSIYPEFTNYNISKAIKLYGNINIQRVEETISKLIERHEAFRTAFVLKNLDVYQKIYNSLAENKFQYMDAVGKDIKQIISKLNQPYQLGKPGLFFVYLIKESENCHILYINIHHIIADATSIEVFLKEFCMLYEKKELKEITLTYKDYAKWQQNLIQNEDTFKEHKEFWNNKLKGNLHQLQFAYDFDNAQIIDDKGATYSLELSLSLVDQLNLFKQKTGTTTYMVMLAAFNILLSKSCNQLEFVIGSPVVNRSNSEMFHVIGVFINTVIHTVKINKEYNVLQYLDYIKKDTIDVLKYQDFPIYQIEEMIGQINSNGQQGLFNVMFSLIEMETQSYQIGSQSMIPYSIANDTSMFDLTLEVMEVNHNVSLNFEYKTSLFQQETIKNFAKRYIFVLEQMITNPALSIKNINITPRKEKEKILDFSRGKKLYVDNELIYQLIEKQAEKNPNNIALKTSNDLVTYKEFNEQANQIANYIREKGVKRNEFVGIHMNASCERIITILAVLKAGAAYLPIDKNFPLERMKYMLEDSHTKMILSDKLNWEVDDYKGTIVTIQELDLSSFSQKNLEPINNSHDIAYMIYTSGTSGKPKGVMVEHRNLSSYVDAFLDEFSVNNKDVMMQQASVAFDASIEEIFPILTQGGSLAIAEKEELIDLKQLNNFLSNNKVSIISSSPYLLNEINKIWESKQIHTFISGGDVLRKEYITNLISLGKIYNTYGPTETTVCATYYKVKKEEGKKIPIGSPIKNYGVYILDEEFQFCPIGTVGEICISGVGVTRGYLNNGSLTQEKFISNPYDSENIIYRTGDLGRWLLDGNIEYIGRCDDQINIRGYRIELGEIESTLLAHEDIQEVVVINKEYVGEYCLCAYIKGNRTFSIEELNVHLKKYLPSYMIPSYFVNVESFSLNTSGKIDKNMLPDPFNKVISETQYIEPQTETEQKMAEIWSKILNVKKIGSNDNFFHLGGQSLKAIILATQIEEVFQVHITTSNIFKNPILKDICNVIENEKPYHEELEKFNENLEYYKTSQQQRNLFVLQEMSKNSVHYNMPAVFIAKGKLNIKKLQDCVNKIIRGNEIFRTSFHVEDTIIVQKIHEELNIVIDYEEAKNKNIDAYVTSFVRPFDLQQLPLIRIGVKKLEEGEFVVVVDIHHIISDARSIQLFMSEVLNLYLAERVEEYKFQYKDFSEWQNKFIESESYEKQKKYWREVYENTPPILNFSTDYTRPAAKNYEGNSVELEIGKELTENIRNLAKQLHGTNFMLLYCVYSILLSKYTSQNDFVIGIPTQGRTLKGTHNIYGNFVNTLAIRNDVRKDLTFKQYFELVKETLATVFDNQDYSFDELVNDLKLPYNSSRNPLFDTMFSFIEEKDEKIELKDLSIAPIHLKYNTSKFDFGLDIIENSDSFNCILNYSTQLFHENTMKRFLNYISNIINSIILNQDIEMSKICIMNDDEKYQVIHGFNCTKKTFQEKRPIVFLIEEQCKKNPHNTAVVFNDQSLTYHELYLKSNTLARKLMNYGVGKGDFVPVIMGRSLELVTSIYSIMKTGAAFVPIDMNWPLERMNHILEELDAKVTVTNLESKWLEKKLESKLICCDLSTLDEDHNSIHMNVTLDSSLYIIYTSGSTGKPKGVTVPNKGILNRFLWMNDYFGKNACSSVLQTTNHVYDSSVWQFFWPLINGGKTILPNSDSIMDAYYILHIIEKHQITMIDFVPSVFNTIIYQLKEGSNLSGQLQSLQCVILGGEEIIPKTVYYFQKLFTHVRIFNLYGPTEASIGCICHEVLGTEGDCIPIGKPISNVNIYILDSMGHAVPIGVPGEIYISGICLAEGYYKDEEKTKAMFIHNPLRNNHDRVYKTGDIAKYREDGEIIYLGRKDNQVKIRGFRIELGEIESVIRTHKEVSQAVVVIEKQENQDAIICAYFVGSVNENNIKEYLFEKLPYYMVPNYICKLEDIPLSAGGKVNRKALPKPIFEIQEDELFIPSNLIEEKIVEMYKNILNIDKINANLNFFEQGGNSLSATILLARLNNVFQVHMQIGDVFSNPTIPLMAQKVSNHIGITNTLVKRTAIADFYETTSAQKRMLILNSFHKDSLDYNIPMVFHIKKGNLDIKILEANINEIVKRHEGLRTYFGYQDGLPVQYISECELKIQIVHTSARQLNQTIHSLIQPFDLMKAPLLRIYLLMLDSNETYLLIDMHHIIVDGVSIDIMMKELHSIYSEIELSNNIYQYRDYTNWYHEFMNTEQYNRKKKYWMEQFKNLPPYLKLEPMDSVEMEPLASKSFVESIVLDKEMTDQINQYIQNNKITLYMYMLSILNTILFRLTNEEDIAIGTPVSGRTQSEFEHTVGLFVNTIVLRNYPKAEKTFKDLTLDIKENVISGIDNQEYAFDDLIDDLKLNRSLDKTPLFNIMFLVEKVKNQTILLGDVELEPYHYQDDNIKFDMNFNVIEFTDSIKLEMICDHKIISQELVKNLLKYMTYIIEQTLDNPMITLSDIILIKEEISLDNFVCEELDLDFAF